MFVCALRHAGCWFAYATAAYPEVRLHGAATAYPQPRSRRIRTRNQWLQRCSRRYPRYVGYPNRNYTSITCLRFTRDTLTFYYNNRINAWSIYLLFRGWVISNRTSTSFNTGRCVPSNRYAPRHEAFPRRAHTTLHLAPAALLKPPWPRCSQKQAGWPPWSHDRYLQINLFGPVSKSTQEFNEWNPTLAKRSEQKMCLWKISFSNTILSGDW